MVNHEEVIGNRRRACRGFWAKDWRFSL